jgi:hypothetical protein
MSEYHIDENRIYQGPRIERMRELQRQQETERQETKALVLSTPTPIRAAPATPSSPIQEQG